MGTVCSSRTARGQYSSVQRNLTDSIDSTTAQTVTCPTCNGKGKVDIEPGQSPEQLVALIPYRDKRLKPRRTKLYVAVTVVVCAVISGLLLFFLLPRSVSVKLSQPYMLNYSAPVNESVVLVIKFTMYITNDNYVGISVGGIETTVSERSAQIGTLLSNRSDLSISMRSTKKLVHEMELKFKGGQGVSVRKICAGMDWPPYKLSVLFQEMVSYTFLTSSEKLANMDYFLLHCETNTPSSDRMDGAV